MQKIWWTMKRFVLVFLCCIVSASFESTCKDSSDCSGNGVCKNNYCKCYDGWQGSQCQFCGGKVKLTASLGAISNGPRNYSADMKCTWLLQAPNASITLHIENFATECGWDHLYVFDGDSAASPLLSAFTGSMYGNKYSIRKIPTVVAQSGYALVHFHSDSYYNMSGFNITYRLNACPSNMSRADCSGNGICSNGVCLSDEKWNGVACHLAKCPNDCWSSENKGKCELNIGCICNNGWKGSDCRQHIDRGYWESVVPQGFVPLGSASHTAVVWKDHLIVVGGESYRRGQMMNIYDFQANLWEAAHITGLSPSPRFAHSLVQYDGKLFIYGGFADNQGPTSELWIFDIELRMWKNITNESEPCHGIFKFCAPLKSVGHTSTVVTNPSDETLDRMVIIFGYSPTFGYLNTVQEYYFSSSKWNIVQTQGYPVTGCFGHSSSWDKLTNKIYVYGGIGLTSESTTTLSANLYSYDYDLHIWTLLAEAPSARYLHTATFVSPGLMVVFGGNPYKDFHSKCYSSEVFTYDVECNSWHELNVTELQTDLARYGHTAALYDGSLYIYGGFDGQMLSDILRYTPGNCSSLKTPTVCLKTQIGVKCAWNKTKTACVAVQDISGHDNGSLKTCVEKIPVSEQQTQKLCKTLHNCKACELESSCMWNHANNTCTSSSLFEPKPSQQLRCPKSCSEYTSCLDCTKGDCIWCQNEGKCVDINAYTVNFPYGQCRGWMTESDKCPKESLPCKSYQTCHQCREDPACGWCDDGSQTGLGECMVGGYLGGKCAPEKWYFTTCPECQCNGHAHCRANQSSCVNCSDFTTGPRCQRCVAGTWGNALNGGTCRKCNCKGPATLCHPETGKCYCTTKGNIGNHCGKCDVLNNYHKDSLNKNCYYTLFTNYRFTFSLSKTTDLNYTRINFKNSPVTADTDVIFEISCSKMAKMNVTMRISSSEDEKPIFTGYSCDKLKSVNRFSSSDYVFGTKNNDSVLTTFHVYVYNLQPPLVIEVSLAQYPWLNCDVFSEHYLCKV